jgi:hypothetical protein
MSWSEAAGFDWNITHKARMEFIKIRTRNVDGVT